MEIDLRKDVEDIRAMLADAVSRYAAKNADPTSAPEYAPVSALNLTYNCGSGARVVLQFDTRPDFEPDGTWSHEAFAELERPQWETAYTALQEHDLLFILADGSSYTLKAAADDEAYVTVFGLMLVDVLTLARDAGELVALPKMPGCELGVEEIEGMFGWPAYEERGQDNMAQQSAA